MENDKLISIGETAKLFGVSIQTLRRWDVKGTLKVGWQWASQTTPSEPVKEFYSSTSDVFTARLTRLENDLKKIADLGIHHSLLTSMVGEIGDNSYAHNLGNWPDILGIFFAYDLNKRVIVLADRGRGILETLRLVRPKLQSHQEALKVAFTEIISGRFPERRGNGLKSVVQNILTSDVNLIFRTGSAELDLKKGDRKLNITECETFHGCFAILKF